MLSKVGKEGLKLFEKFKVKAGSYVNDKEKLGKLINDAIKMAKDNKIVNDFSILIELVRDWGSGKYKDVKKTTIIIIVAALIYLVSPIDVLPDILPGGLIDDAFILEIVFKRLKKEIDFYRMWKGIQGEE